MTQLGLAGDLGPLAIQPIYLLDASSLIRLDGKDRLPPNPPEFTNQERALIWEGLEHLTEAGRLKLITQVKKELRRWHPEGLKRLVGYKGHSLIIKKTRQVIYDYQNIITLYPNIGPKPGRDPADPWLIHVSRKRGFTIVTQEESLTGRKSAKRDLRIPDVCQRDNLPPALNIRDLANHEGWLTT